MGYIIEDGESCQWPSEKAPRGELAWTTSHPHGNMCQLNGAELQQTYSNAI